MLSSGPVAVAHNGLVVKPKDRVRLVWGAPGWWIITEIDRSDDGLPMLHLKHSGTGRSIWRGPGEVLAPEPDPRLANARWPFDY